MIDFIGTSTSDVGGQCLNAECWLLVVNGFKLSRPTGVAMSDPSVILTLPDILM